MNDRRFSPMGTAPSPVDERDHDIRAYGVNPRMASSLPDEIGQQWVASCPPIGDQHFEGSCFPAGTLIRMADGSSVPIEQVRTLDRVATAEGREGRVTTTMARHYEGDLLTVALIGHPGVPCTPEHPLLTSNGYLPASEVQEGDLVALTRHTPEMVKEIRPFDLFSEADLYRTRRSGSTGKGKIFSVPEEIVLTPGLGRLLGLYAAEGSATSQRIQWTFGSHEKDTLVQETVDLLRDELGITSRVQPRPNNSINVIVYGKLWKTLFTYLIGNGSANKGLHPTITAGPDDFRLEVIRGWMDGDGHYRRRMGEGVSVGKRLIFDLHGMAQGLGLAPALSRREPVMNAHAKTRRLSWTLSLADDFSTRDAHQWMSQEDQVVWRKVRKITPTSFFGWVFNLSVEGDESYVAEGIGVHNCTGWAYRNVKTTMERSQRTGSRRARVPEFGPRGIYHLAKKVGGYPDEEGAYMRDVLKAADTHGSPREIDWPYVPHSDATGVHDIGVPKMRWLTNAKRWQIGAYARLRTIEEMLVSLHTVGPLFIAMNLTDSFFTPQDNGDIDPPSGSDHGGHAMAAIAANRTRRRLLVANSWSTSWGLAGFCWVDFDHFLSARSEAWVIPDSL
jgi:hypothetical protein